MPEKVSLSGQRGSILAVQGVDGSLGVGNVELLDVSNPAQACDLAIDRVECTGSLKLAQPGVLVRTGHIVVGVVTGNDHQRAEHDLGVTGSLDSLDDILAGGGLRLALNSADEDIVIGTFFKLEASGF